ncbi:MAG: hypothetical protein LBT47_00500 [Deltaproteobacteria bacterium]|nr:hypothetical protein [Deltaproteobacteria bacterium]
MALQTPSSGLPAGKKKKMMSEKNNNSPPDPENYKEDSSHYEGHANIWEAILGDSGLLVKLLPHIVSQANMRPDWMCEEQNSDGFNFLLFWPTLTPPGIAALIRHQAGSETNECETSYPVLEGALVDLRLESVYPWLNGLEGEICGRTACGQMISFFDCFYFKNKSQYFLDAIIPFRLFGIAFSLGVPEEQSLVSSEGRYYERQKSKFLKENPGQGPEDFQNPSLSLVGSKILFPSEYCSIYNFRTPIKSVVSVKIAGLTLYKLGVILGGLDDDELPCELYASEHVLNGYSPKTGDDIQGVLRLAGYIASEFEKLQ